MSNEGAASGRSPDGYEAKYMAGDGAVIYRDKRVAPKIWHVLFGIPTLMMAAGIPMTLLHVGSKPAPLWMIGFFIPMMALFALLWVGMSVIRVAVSSTAVSVQYGLFGSKIPLAAIRSARATTYHWTDYGGWGIKRSFDGTWAYTLPGDGGRAVMIEWTDAAGKERKTLVGCADAEAFAAAIARARSATGVRVDAGTSGVALTDAGAAVELESARGDDARRGAG